MLDEVSERGEGRTLSVVSRMRTTTLFRSLRSVTRACRRRWKGKAYGVTSSWFPARNGSRIHRSGTFCLFNDSPI